MRLDHLCFSLLALLIGGAQTAVAAEREPIPVQWYEPKVQPTDVAGLTFVNLIGATQPNVSVEINPESIIVIQPADPKNQLRPRVGETSVKSEAKGFFKLRLFMPNGLSQVPIVLKNNLGEEHTVLLTMRVDPKDVSLNVKVIRPTKTKIVTVMEKPPVQYSLGLDLAPLMFNESLSPAGQADLNLKQNSFQALRMDAGIKSIKWWWNLHYEMANSSAPTSLDGKTVKSGTANMQSILLGGKYRLTNSDHELWLGVDVDARYFPLLALSNANEIYLVDAKVYRAGANLEYTFRTESFDYAVSIFYREPIAIKVSNGAITYASKYLTGLAAEMNYHWSEKWLVGAGFEGEMNSFSYEYDNSPVLINNKGSGNITVFQFLVKLQYLFGGKAKDNTKP